ncbi:hypothetical protein DFH09DRAFT_1308616 [Mycena vulgaris]|nr:hypothetical protein DFH09DRAFT_1308616 [Mycena vulgaris]
MVEFLPQHSPVDFLHRQWNLLDEESAKCSLVIVVQACARKKPRELRVSVRCTSARIPGLRIVDHSSDNCFLQNATSTFNSTEIVVAKEWRAYIASFIRHSDPNTEKLATSSIWHQSSSEYRYEPQMIISMPIAASADLKAPTNSGMQLKDTSEWDRCMLHLSEDVVQYSLQ